MFLKGLNSCIRNDSFWNGNENPKMTAASQGKSHNSGSQAYSGLSVSRPEKSLILNFESSLFTYISMLKRFGHFLMNSIMCPPPPALLVKKIRRLSKG